MESYRLLISPWKKEFIEILSEIGNELIICSPFISMGGVNILIDNIQKKDINFMLITNISLDSLEKKSLDPEALLNLYKMFNKIQILSIRNLHAKIYLIDSQIGIITSANLTEGGLKNNLEFGILVKDEKLISNLKKEILQYSKLGYPIEEEFLKRIIIETNNFYKIKKNLENELEKSSLALLLAELKQTKEKIEIQNIENTIRKGTTIHSIFRESILYLHEKYGPLTTRELHPLIQTLHPDICNDDIDRIINGQHFGKKWKHHVRASQESLANQRLIYRTNDGKWHLQIEDK